MIQTNKIYKMEALELLKQLPDNSVDLVLTDPPYGITQNKWDKPIDFQEFWRELKRVGKEDCAFVFTASQPFTTDLINSNREMFKYELVWEKSKSSGFLNANRMPLRSHENIIVFYEKLGIYNPQKIQRNPYNKGLRKSQDKEDNYGQYSQTIVESKEGLRFPRSVMYFKTAESEGNTFHKTQKPLALFQWLIKSYSKENQLVLDCFVGSGTTAVASKKLNRNFICCDINEEYVKIAESRLLEIGETQTKSLRDFPTESLICVKEENQK